MVSFAMELSMSAPPSRSSDHNAIGLSKVYAISLYGRVARSVVAPG